MSVLLRDFINYNMEGEGPAKFYSPKEEKWNVISHAFGLALSIIAAYFLVVRASGFANIKMTISFVVFGVSLILLYAASTFYHNAKDPALRFKLKILDHIGIFILIAGTYTPFALVTLGGSIGWIILSVAWGIAFLGTILKIFFTGRFKVLSTLMYVGMGWIIIFAIKPLIENLSSGGLWWLFAGGFFYTLGAILYSISRINYNHAWFHLFVLLGSFCHFMAIFFHVVP